MDLTLLVLVVIFALIFDFINGFHDTANAVATSILTRALSMRNAILLSGMGNFVGALLWVGVATTIGKGIADPTHAHITTPTVLAALSGAIAWDLLTWYWGLPTSSSHALIGGVIGAVATSHGFGVLEGDGIKKIAASLLISPVLGLAAGYTLMVALSWAFQNKAPGPLNRKFKVLQVCSATAMAFSHGSNDAQKSMGIITMALVAHAHTQTFAVPTWVKVSCALMMAMGTAAGGWRIIRTVGKKIMGLHPVHGFASETSAALVIAGASHLGLPVSTTHVISSCIMGVGASRRLSAVRWGIVRQIVVAWIFTAPAAALFAAAFSLAFRTLR